MSTIYAAWNALCEKAHRHGKASVVATVVYARQLDVSGASMDTELMPSERPQQSVV
jgi:hypothetical protein